MSMPWTAFANIERLAVPSVLRAVTVDDFIRTTLPPSRCALLLDDGLTREQRDRVAAHAQWGALIGGDNDAPHWRGPRISSIARGPLPESGDIIAVDPGRPLLRYLHRSRSQSNVLFVTTRCNCACLMCSQPPADEDDRRRHGELLAQVELTDPRVTELGISGGEPTLLGSRLVELIRHARQYLPTTSLHVLTNARLLASGSLADDLAAVEHPDLMWGVPVNAEVARVHDEIMGAPGAFAETTRGVHRLLARGLRVEIRVIVQKKNVERLPEIARYLFWNFPNVEHIAFMGLEPMGWARKNREDVYTDVALHADSLEKAVHFLADRGLNVSVYNVPLCLVPRTLWSFCRQSISDWKHRFLPACDRCDVKSSCAGFFGSVTPEWISPHVSPVNDVGSLA